ncbi:DUF4440 domain-containing protein [Kordiimonas laminariae]|uniref:nuclear transport factor 2 family protein n=1 Tax=Kordiimonas laminariae TaxID=2917717 RepID=UPI001FF5465F|nr:DUF4440 domain-containing protein [Kordiimonas laminariae]MCK0069297.1 nuclear transport factor 2 family protein [Kordiimonas laminariae]
MINESEKKALYTLEKKLAKSTCRTDKTFLQNTLSDNFKEFGSSGRIFSKVEIIDLLTTESSFTDYELEDFQAVSIDEKTVHVTYLIPPRTLTDGTARKGSLRSSIWSRINGDWQILFHQGTLRP